MTVTVTKEVGTRTGGIGSLVLRITGTASYPLSVYAQHELVLEAGKEYRLRGWVRSDPTNAFDAVVCTSRIDLGGADTPIASVIGSSAWSDFDETFTPTHDSYLRFGGDAAAPEFDYWFEFDDMTLWDTSAAAADPLFYWTASVSASLDKDLTEVFEGLQSLSVGTTALDFSKQDVNLDERYSLVEDAFVMFDSGNGILQSRVLDSSGGGGEA